MSELTFDDDVYGECGSADGVGGHAGVVAGLARVHCRGRPEQLLTVRHLVARAVVPLRPVHVCV